MYKDKRGTFRSDGKAQKPLDFTITYTFIDGLFESNRIQNKQFIKRTKTLVEEVIKRGYDDRVSD